ncbi:MAG: hypothetical protein OEY09_20465 [Gammaproteobacteria bacterium]|nr:hypothetical protein [Gammaproteobacteria bacterium]
MSLCAIAQIRALISSFEAGEAMDRSLARVGLVIVGFLMLAATYYFVRGFQIVIF